MGWRVMCRLTSSQLLSLQETKSQSQMLYLGEEGDQPGEQPRLPGLLPSASLIRCNDKLTGDIAAHGTRKSTVTDMTTATMTADSVSSSHTHPTPVPSHLTVLHQFHYLIHAGAAQH